MGFNKIQVKHILFSLLLVVATVLSITLWYKSHCTQREYYGELIENEKNYMLLHSFPRDSYTKHYLKENEETIVFHRNGTNEICAVTSLFYDRDSHVLYFQERKYHPVQNKTKVISLCTITMETETVEGITRIKNILHISTDAGFEDGSGVYGGGDYSCQIEKNGSQVSYSYSVSAGIYDSHLTSGMPDYKTYNSTGIIDIENMILEIPS